MPIIISIFREKHLKASATVIAQTHKPNILESVSNRSTHNSAGEDKSMSPSARLCLLLLILTGAIFNANATTIAPGGVSEGAVISTGPSNPVAAILAPPMAGCYEPISGGWVCTLPWADMTLPVLNIGKTARFSTTTPPWYYLGNQLDGRFAINLDPIFPLSTAGSGPYPDELDVILAIDSFPLELAKTVNGSLTFTASAGTEYYLLVRPDTDYRLAVNSIPEPATLSLIAIAGMGLILPWRRRGLRTILPLSGLSTRPRLNK